MTDTDQTPLILADPPPPLEAREVTPLSVLQTARGPWQVRKKAWAQAGLTGDAGRDHITIWPTISKTAGIEWQRAVSVFDPHLTDVHYTWYCPPGGLILDPFAGGATRGLVAAHRGYHYTGIDLSEQQVEANRQQYQAWQDRGLVTGSAKWIVGSAQEALPCYQTGWADYIFTCPPYHGLERYSDDPRDLSAMDWDEYLHMVNLIAAECARILKQDRFTTWITGDLRDKNGHLRRLPSKVDDAHEHAGLALANDTIIAAPLGGKFGVIWRNWVPTRSTTRIHQHAHTWVSGNRKTATTAATR
ncbi:class I SAM-dependent methyltransferase [Nocardiopsis lucentensis]|uniref:RsmD family RNA methyltransferase n=1 Tax=Nocardiopsis lucentensis TaxID=53441 RepID=UPI000349E77E|nr:RsmD family RNA methyltransferase [Nocardiopsis lucentensis]